MTRLQYLLRLGFVAWGALVVLGVRLASVLRRQRFRLWWDRATGTVLGVLGGGLVFSRG